MSTRRQHVTEAFTSGGGGAMPGWSNSDRRSRLPADWGKVRTRVLRRDLNQCQVKMLDGSRCRDIASDVDHIRNGDDHHESNLQAICDWHHKNKSSSEGAMALAKKRRAIHRRFRTQEAHPGDL